MSAGQLDKRVTIETRTVAQGAGAALDETFTPLATVWARARTQRGVADVEGVNLGEQATHAWRIRHRTDVTRENFLTFGGRRFEILEVTDPDERGRWLDLLCREVGDS